MTNSSLYLVTWPLKAISTGLDGNLHTGTEADDLGEKITRNDLTSILSELFYKVFLYGYKLNCMLRLDEKRNSLVKQTYSEFIKSYIM